MKRLIAAVLSLAAALGSGAEPSQINASVRALPIHSGQQPEETTVRKPLDLHSTHVTVIQPIKNEAGKSSFQTNASYIELGNGLNYLSADGSLLPSVPEFELISGAAIAWHGQTKVTLGATLDSTTPVQIRLPDGQLMSSRVHGVALYDAATGQSVLVSNIREGVQGVQIAPDQIIYPDCLEGAISGDLKYTIRLDGLEQDLVIRQAELSEASLQSFGIDIADPAKVTIETWSEFLSAPDPIVRPVARQNNFGGRSLVMVDQDLHFGSGMRMAAGRSFLVGKESQSLSFVSKEWVTTPDARKFLVESVPLSLVESHVPAAQPGKPGAMKSFRKPSHTRLEALNALPRQRKESREASILPLKSAAKGLLAWLSQPGLVLDYATISGGLTNYTFAGNGTYYLSSATTCYGTNTWVEGGAVLKYASNATLTIKTPLTWQASNYRPAIFCSVDDKSCGEFISGSTGTPSTNWYATTALILDASSSGATNTAFNLAHLRVANAQTAIQIIQGTNAHTVKHAQFVNCGNGIAPSSTTLSVQNALFVNVGTNFNGSATVGDLEHVTSDTAAYFAAGSTFSLVGLTNCILTGVTNANVGTVTNQVAILASGSGVFQNLSVGTSHYLVTNSPYRNLGTTGINPTLAGELIDLTTYAPIELGTNWTLSANTALVPVIQRDTDLPDLGYHEYPLDYIVKGISIGSTNTLNLLNGVAVGFYGTSGVTPGTTAKFSSFGLPENLNRLTMINTVFEQPQSWLTGLSSFTLINGPGQNLRFTDVPYLAGPTTWRRIYPDLLSGTATIQDCQLRGVYWYFYAYSGSGASAATITLRNNLLERCSIDWTQGYTGVGYFLTLTWQNNLFSRCTIALAHDDSSFGNWTTYDNLFDNCPTVSKTEFDLKNPSTLLGYNGYINTSRFLLGTGDKTGLSRDFISGPLGDYYYPTNSTANSLSTLIGADTVRTPATSGIGLSQYTTTLDQVRDSGTNLDIGMHYVALESHRASLEFSGTQGTNNWYYERTTTPQGSVLTYLPTFSTQGTGPTWWDSSLTGSDTYVWIWATGQHPGVNYDSVRVWQSLANARASIWGTALNSGSCPQYNNDGTQAQIQRNTLAVTPWISVATNFTASVVNGRTLIQVGDTIRFQLNKNAANGCDATTWDPLIVVHHGIDSDGDGIPDWFEDSNGDGVVNSSDGLGDFDGDGVSDRLDGRPFDPTSSTFQVTIERPVNGSTVN